MTLELLALQWLRWQRKCWLVTLERGICMGNPDVFGITKGRQCIEIEIKRTLSDFKANAQKNHVHYREDYKKRWPTWFYYLVPEMLQPKVEPLLPSWAGLMVADGKNYLYPKVIVQSPLNKEAPRVSIKNVARMVTMQANTLVSLKGVIDRGVKGSMDDWARDYSI